MATSDLLQWSLHHSKSCDCHLIVPSMVSDPRHVRGDDKETASTIMAFFLSGGLLSGGALSFLWTKLARLHK